MQVIPGCRWLAVSCWLLQVAACFYRPSKQPAKSIRPNFTAGVSVSLSEFSAPASAFPPMSKAACPRTFVSSSPPLVPYYPATPSHWLALLCFAAAQSSHRCCCARLCLCKRKAEPERANSAAQRSTAPSNGARANKKHQGTQIRPRRDPLQVSYTGAIRYPPCTGNPRGGTTVTCFQMRQNKKSQKKHWPVATLLLTATCSKYRGYPTPPYLKPHSRG
ncbi:hypothetical protein CNYM01_07859 [Colletotrichum nymphaeae SA-01]|uniref:Secreted protein n=1 Tax=Colletotrichum nymphaeae SA-01 TaxID=1460502 RepID=A0A135UI51_9PEZI|nr:hypothetical protein CNYM01_07859 [Colletotrichum nymphaeae SA-01]